MLDPDGWLDRAHGCLLGLCAGGARGHAAAIGPGAVTAGAGGQGRTTAVGPEATLALALAESWLANGTLEPSDLADRWGALVVGGRLEAGATTAAALLAVAAGEPGERATAVAARLRPDRAGDGAMARALPLVVATAGDRVLLRRLAYRSAAVTHADPVATFSAVAACLLGLDLCRHPLEEACRRTVQALREDLPDRALAALHPPRPGEPPEPGDDAVGVLAQAVAGLAGTTTPADAVEAALDHATAPGSCGALTGGLAGLRDGASAIPEGWVAALGPELRTRCRDLAAGLAGRAPATP